MDCDHSNYDEYFQKCTDCGKLAHELGLSVCEDCGTALRAEEIRHYKYEPELILCDGCHDERMEDEYEQVISV